ncbi:hypothetical protein ACWEPC_40590 [Nonomuraea sp. NPDC004297]
MSRSRRGFSPAFSAVLTVVAVLLVLMTVPNLGTVVRAARADGAPGEFVPRELFCVSHPGHESCVWTGDFRAAGGSAVRAGVELYGSDRGSQRAGQPVPAVDVGAPSRVYGPGGSNEWIFNVALLALALAIVWIVYARRLLVVLRRARPPVGDRA